MPDAAYRPLSAVERALAPLAPLLAFRCLVVLERPELLVLAPVKIPTRNFQNANAVMRRSRSPWRKRLMFVSPYVRAW